MIKNLIFLKFRCLIQWNENDKFKIGILIHFWDLLYFFKINRTLFIEKKMKQVLWKENQGLINNPSHKFEWEGIHRKNSIKWLFLVKKYLSSRKDFARCGNLRKSQKLFYLDVWNISMNFFDVTFRKLLNIYRQLIIWS